MIRAFVFIEAEPGRVQELVQELDNSSNYKKFTLPLFHSNSRWWSYRARCAATLWIAHLAGRGRSKSTQLFPLPGA